MSDQDAENNNPKNVNETGLRFNTGKVRMELIPPGAMMELGKVYEAGALKYSDNNWRKGMRYGIAIGAVFRHVFKWMSGEPFDAELFEKHNIKCHHLAMAAWNCLAVVQWQIDGVGEDDRYKAKRKTGDKVDFDTDNRTHRYCGQSVCSICNPR